LIALLLSIGASLIASLVLTSLLIKLLHQKQLGQFIRLDGPETHLVKRGTPTMGGTAILLSVLIGYVFARIYMFSYSGSTPHISAYLLLGLIFAMGTIGFVDDFIKVHKEQSLGLTVRAKFALQLLVSVTFGVLSLLFPNDEGITPASAAISFVRDFNWNFSFFGVVVGAIIFVIWASLIIVAWTNATNLTDGLDGLAAGVSLFSFAAYTIICFWQFLQSCSLGFTHNITMCYNVRDPWDLTLIAGSITGACFGFLWHNAKPAKIFMGDTGSLALGGAFAGLSILSHTELLAIIIGSVYVMECASVALQVGFFKHTGRRVFKMAPIHHHFEMKGWAEVNVVIRFWIIAALMASLALGLFYAGWLQGVNIE
jgi:phospho-N-acetylmuramoyl-pentapeptide-transferase